MVTFEGLKSARWEEIGFVLDLLLAFLRRSTFESLHGDEGGAQRHGRGGLQ